MSLNPGLLLACLAEASLACAAILQSWCEKARELTTQTGFSPVNNTHTHTHEETLYTPI